MNLLQGKKMPSVQRNDLLKYGNFWSKLGWKKSKLWLKKILVCIAKYFKKNHAFDTSEYQSFDTRTRMSRFENNLSFKIPSFLIVSLIQVVKLVVTEKHAFDYREETKLVSFYASSDYQDSSPCIKLVFFRNWLACPSLRVSHWEKDGVKFACFKEGFDFQFRKKSKILAVLYFWEYRNSDANFGRMGL